MEPEKHQYEKAKEVLKIMYEHKLCYLAMEERTGKTLISFIVAKLLPLDGKILVLTKKAAIAGWLDTVAAYKFKLSIDIINYHSAHKFEGPYSLVILDESHNYLSACPKPTKIWRTVKGLAEGSYVLLLSATPHPQGMQQLYHQLEVSSYSPFRHFRNFYEWFRIYGIPKIKYVYNRQINTYNDVRQDAVLKLVKHLFVTGTRKELGFKHEPEDEIHVIELTDYTKGLYNKLRKDSIVAGHNNTIVADTIMALRTYLHMIEGGTVNCRHSNSATPYSIVLKNAEKIDYILSKWGDTEDLAIYYFYRKEKEKLEGAFKNALLLQSSTHAEGIDLAHIKDIVVYSQDFSTSKYIQRRARQSSKYRNMPIKVNFLVVKKAISEEVYTTVACNKKNYTDIVFEGKYL